MLRWILAGAQLMRGDDFATRAENCDVDTKKNNTRNYKCCSFHNYVHFTRRLSARLAIVSLCAVDHSTVRHTTSRQSREILDKFFLLFSHFGMMKIYPEGDTDLMAKKKWELLCRKNHMNLESNRITSECWLSPSWLPTMLVGLVRRPKTFYAIKLKKLNFEVRFSSSFSRDIYFFHDQLFFLLSWENLQCENFGVVAVDAVAMVGEAFWM